MKLSDEVRRRLDDPVYRRRNVEHLDAALKALGVDASLDFRDFYKKYEGPFGGEIIGFELLDLWEREPNVLEVTRVCRDEFGWPPRLVVLTELLGNAVIVLDTENDCVYNVDFEGGDDELLAGALEPTWVSFGDFLAEFFG